MINENLQILATLGSSLTIYIFLRIAARKEVKELKEEFKEVKTDLKSIDQLLTRLEGRFDERGFLNSRHYPKTGTEDKK